MRARRLTFSCRILRDGRGDVWVINGVKPWPLITSLPSACCPALLSLYHSVIQWHQQVAWLGGAGRYWICPSVFVPGGNWFPAEMQAKFNLNALMIMKLKREVRIWVTAGLKLLIECQSHTSRRELIVFFISVHKGVTIWDLKEHD